MNDTTARIISILLDASMGATALYTVRQLSAAVRALTEAVAQLRDGHKDHEGRLEALERSKAP